MEEYEKIVRNVDGRWIDMSLGAVGSKGQYYSVLSCLQALDNNNNNEH